MGLIFIEKLNFIECLFEIRLIKLAFNPKLKDFNANAISGAYLYLRQVEMAVL